MPYRDFQINEILTAANVNTYLMNQTIMTFADATARDAALTSPSEGMFAYLSGTNLLTFYDGAAWQEFTSGGGGVTVSATAPATPDDGALWWDSDDGELYLYYNDGSSSQWVAAAGPSVTVAATAPTGYEGQLWLDSTDGSMYVYYTDPGGANAQWIGAVSRSGGILQVVSTTKTDTFSAAVATPAFTSNVTGLEATITPTSTSSKILVQLSITGSRTGNYAIVVPRLMRDSTPIGIATGTSLRAAAGGVLSIVSAHTGSMGVTTTDYLDSPNTTSSITYGVQLTGISGTQTVYVNRSAGDSDSTSVARAVSTITLMEVAG